MWYFNTPAATLGRDSAAERCSKAQTTGEDGKKQRGSLYRLFYLLFNLHFLLGYQCISWVGMLSGNTIVSISLFLLFLCQKPGHESPWTRLLTGRSLDASAHPRAHRLGERVRRYTLIHNTGKVDFSPSPPFPWFLTPREAFCVTTNGIGLVPPTGKGEAIPPGCSHGRGKVRCSQMNGQRNERLAICQVKPTSQSSPFVIGSLVKLWKSILINNSQILK